MNILINRSDNLGDIVYTLQLASLLKNFYPNAQVCFMVRNYAAPLLEHATDVDSLLIFEQFKTLTFIQKIKTLKQYDVFINAKAQAGMAFYAFCAGIKTRIGSSRRWCNLLFCNKCVSIQRKGSNKHEVDFNAQLLEPLIGKINHSTQALFNHIKLSKKKDSLFKVTLPKNKILVICHPGSNGNGREWPLEHFVELVNLSDETKYHFILTGGKAETQQAKAIESKCNNVTNLAGSLSLTEFIELLSRVDVLIASGTGPLHIAAALGTKTIGLFPPIHALDSKRWGPMFPNAINLEQKNSCQQTCSNQICACMRSLSPSSVHQTLLNSF